MTILNWWADQLCAIDLRKHDPNKDTQTWENCTCHLRPLLARQKIILESIGWDETNINTGKAFAHLLTDQTLPLTWCVLISTDSNNAKSLLINLLKEPLAYTHRYCIRKLYSPMSKTLMTLWQSLLNCWHDTDWPLQHPTQWNLLQTLLPTIQKWTLRPPWTPQHAYLKGGRWIIKIKSHQLTDMGGLKKNTQFIP